uniref:RBR-type E3 ubiquitin transferase n=1 Tax=Nicotiana sylvestris TaxID=4096 RepID=A0A1U7X850_NICSY|nr:PREDICTED: protein ariadne-1-like [Nicotiana sylvestris]
MSLPYLISDREYANKLQMQHVLVNSLDVIARWEEGLTESAIPIGEKLYCPYERCSKLLIYDHGKKMLHECICPWCQKLFCAQCRVPWHSGRDCYKFQKEEKDREDDQKVKLLAENKKWINCPSCKSLVEKVDGCKHMTCRCKMEFCYKCGGTWSEKHWSCQTR